MCSEYTTPASAAVPSASEDPPDRRPPLHRRRFTVRPGLPFGVAHGVPRKGPRNFVRRVKYKAVPLVPATGCRGRCPPDPYPDANVVFVGDVEDDAAKYLKKDALLCPRL